MIDVLRWSTVVIEALANGAARVEAFASADEAIARAAELGRADVVLGGERGNLPLPGFDLGNSPGEYTESRVRGRVVITTTTNGTPALVAARHAAVVLVAAYRNRSAVVAALTAVRSGVSGITLLAAGQEGVPALEDLLCARSIARALSSGEAERASGGKPPDPEEAEDPSCSPHALALRAAGFAGDVRFALLRDVSPIVPRLVEGVLIARSVSPIRGA